MLLTLLCTRVFLFLGNTNIDIIIDIINDILSFLNIKTVDVDDIYATGRQDPVYSLYAISFIFVDVLVMWGARASAGNVWTNIIDIT